MSLCLCHSQAHVLASALTVGFSAVLVAEAVLAGTLGGTLGVAPGNRTTVGDAGDAETSSAAAERTPAVAAAAAAAAAHRSSARVLAAGVLPCWVASAGLLFVLKLGPRMGAAAAAALAASALCRCR